MKDKIRICIISPKYDPFFSGAAKQIQKINKILSKKENLKIEVLTKKMSSEKYIEENINIVRLPKIGLKKLYYTKLGSFFFLISAIFHLLKNKKRYDIIHIIDCYFPAGILAYFANLIGLPVLVKNSIARGAIKKDKWYRKIRIKFFIKSAIMIAISRETYNELLDKGFDKERIVFIPNGVNTKRFEKPDKREKLSLKKKYGFDENSFIVLNVGLQINRKGTELIIESAKKIIKDNRNIHFLLVGPFLSKKYKLKIQKNIKDFNLKKNVMLFGYRKDINDFLKIADAFLFPSNREGLPNALMEAMANGLPVIARKIGGVEDLINHKENGFLIQNDENEVNFIVNFLNQIYNKRELSKEMGEKARKTMIKNYSIEKISEEYYELYKKL